MNYVFKGRCGRDGSKMVTKDPDFFCPFSVTFGVISFSGLQQEVYGSFMGHIQALNSAVGEDSLS